MSSIHTSRPACPDRSEFSSNPENHNHGETISCHQHKKALVLKDLSDCIQKPDEAEWACGTPYSNLMIVFLTIIFSECKNLIYEIQFV
jgi:hypothetical protein